MSLRASVFSTKGLQTNGAVDEIQASFNHTLSKVAIKAPSMTNKGKLLVGGSRKTGNKGKKKVTHSMEVFDSEFSRVFERKEYTQAKVEVFYQQMQKYE